MSNDKDPFAMSDIDTSLPAAAAALSAEDRADLVNALKDKLQSLAGQHSNILETLSPQVRKRVEFLKDIQSQHDELEAKFNEERKALEAKYEKLYQPLYAKRFEIVNGLKEIEEITDGATVKQEGDAATEEEKGIPGFWLTAMKNNAVVGEEITERDEGALKFLKDIKWYRIDNPEGFKLEFHFDPNPYFKNSILTKTYHMIDDDDPILEKTIGTDIEWYPGKCLTKKVLKKKPRKGSKNAKPITKTENCASFFNFFNTPHIPEDEDDLDDDAVEEIHDIMEQDYNVGTTIQDKIIPHAVSWFTGEAAEDDDLDDDDDDDVDSEEDEYENAEDEDDDDKDDEVTKGRKMKSEGALTGKSRQGDHAPDCKQQ